MMARVAACAPDRGVDALPVWLPREDFTAAAQIQHCTLHTAHSSQPIQRKEAQLQTSQSTMEYCKVQESLHCKDDFQKERRDLGQSLIQKLFRDSLALIIIV